MSQKESAVSTPIVDESHWKMEFEELDRRFKSLLTETQAKELAASELLKHDGIVRKIETEITNCRDVLSASSSAFLSASERKHVGNKIEALEHQLNQAQQARERSIRLNGGRIRDAKEWEPKRARWQELSKRARDIERARNMSREW